jgi:hypothetical protein
MLEKILNKYIIEREKLRVNYPLAPYRWDNLNKALPFEFAAYSQFLKEHSSELSNSINDLQMYIVSLKAWEKVISSLEDQELFHAISEFVSPIATLAITLPYVIRSRFIYSVAHLSHQANQIKLKALWCDDLPIDDEIYFKEADKYGSQWKCYKKLKLSLENIANKSYNQTMQDFRNSYNHRYSPRIELGITGLVKRNVYNDGRVSYGFGYIEPILLKDAIPSLIEQHSFCLKAYEKYQSLVNEQTNEINKYLTTISI